MRRTFDGNIRAAGKLRAIKFGNHMVDLSRLREKR
jgi:hypothetical protein